MSFNTERSQQYLFCVAISDEAWTLSKYDGCLTGRPWLMRSELGPGGGPAPFTSLDITELFPPPCSFLFLVLAAWVACCWLDAKGNGGGVRWGSMVPCVSLARGCCIWLLWGSAWSLSAWGCCSLWEQHYLPLASTLLIIVTSWQF